MDDDFNTPEAYSVLFDMAREVNRLKAEDMAAANAMASHLRKLSAVLGLLEQEPEAFLQSGAQADDSEVAEIEALIQQRLDARKAKDGRRQMRHVTVLTRWGSCWKMARKGPPGVVSNCAIAGCAVFASGYRLRHHNIPISSIPGNHTHINSEIIT